MIRVLTIEREYGSGGADIARKLADRLGWKLWDQLMTDEIARQMDCESRAVEQHGERRDPLYYRLFKPLNFDPAKPNIFQTPKPRLGSRGLVLVGVAFWQRWVPRVRDNNAERRNRFLSIGW